MSWSPADRVAAGDLAALVYANPFTPERLALEHRLLGLPPPPPGRAWHAQTGEDEERAARLVVRATALHVASDDGDPPELREAVAIYLLYERFRPRLEALLRGPADAAIPWWGEFAEACGDLLPQAQPRGAIEHLLACLLQVRRAFAAIHAQLVGASRPMAGLRAACWSSVFGADLRRYRTVLWERMRDFPTLVTGPSGSGKELVAQAVGASAYVAVDGRRGRLAGDDAASFLPLAISALSPALVEAELFGHRRGAFTGAVEERAGWLEVCPPHGCVFLDELGEVEPSVQVKLLRVLQTRRFARVGEHAERVFRGRLVAATNRDLAGEIAAGRFRGDVYYRLCADHIRTPSLAELIADDAQELDRLCLAAAARAAGPTLAAEVAAEAATWIRAHLGEGYAWPGNVRELEQCVRSLLLRGSYAP
ncbi:MAG: sigma 54-interacting transcriptional regulator, partial [Planctomycetes bacterium]|nr:sigma 54-interacting transcriptional regulator [Planctomycetota bacterium]